MICSKFQIICTPRFQIIQILNVLKFLINETTFAILATYLWPLTMLIINRRAIRNYFCRLQLFQGVNLNTLDQNKKNILYFRESGKGHFLSFIYKKRNYNNKIQTIKLEWDFKPENRIGIKTINIVRST